MEEAILLLRVIPIAHRDAGCRVVGYDDAKQAFRFINSWGTGFGDGGYAWIAYSFITNAKLAMDAYVLNDAPNNFVANRIDVNLDKVDDIVFHNGSTGATQAWLMSGITRADVYNVGPSLNIADSSGWLPVAWPTLTRTANPIFSGTTARPGRIRFGT